MARGCLHSSLQHLPYLPGALSSDDATGPCQNTPAGKLGWPPPLQQSFEAGVPTGTHLFCLGTLRTRIGLDFAFCVWLAHSQIKVCLEPDGSPTFLKACSCTKLSNYILHGHVTPSFFSFTFCLLVSLLLHMLCLTHMWAYVPCYVPLASIKNSSIYQKREILNCKEHPITCEMTVKWQDKWSGVPTIGILGSSQGFLWGVEFVQLQN